MRNLVLGPMKLFPLTLLEFASFFFFLRFSRYCNHILHRNFSRDYYNFDMPNERHYPFQYFKIFFK